MNFERAAIKGKLIESRENRSRLKNKFKALAASVRQGINVNLTQIEDMEIPQLSQMWGDLETAWAGILSLRSDIDRLEKELD